MSLVSTIDFHVTSACDQECPYCWGPREVDAVDSATARAIVDKIAASDVRRIVFTGGDPMERDDIGSLLRYAREAGLEVALSTNGDKLTADFLQAYGDVIDLISLPLDGASEAVSRKSKNEGHFDAIMKALDMLAAHPAIDVKVATAVTQLNLHDVPNIVHLLDERAATMPNRLFYNAFQAFPRAMFEVNWDELVVSDAEFTALHEQVEAESHRVQINWLSHKTLDKLYVMIFPNGNLVVPTSSYYYTYGPFLKIDNLDDLLRQTDFDSLKHHRPSEGWSKIKQS